MGGPGSHQSLASLRERALAMKSQALEATARCQSHLHKAGQISAPGAPYAEAWLCPKPMGGR